MVRRSDSGTFPRRPSTSPQRASVSRPLSDVRAILERAERSQDRVDARLAMPQCRLLVLPMERVERMEDGAP
jgi:hypothetical protein